MNEDGPYYGARPAKFVPLIHLLGFCRPLLDEYETVLLQIWMGCDFFVGAWGWVVVS